MKKENNVHRYGNTINELLELAYSFQKSRVLLTAFELNIFTVLDTESKTALEIAKKTYCDPKAIERLMNALCSLELVKKFEDRYYNTESSADLLIKGKPDYIGNLKHLSHLWDTWSTLTEAVRKGSSVVAGKDSVRTQDNIKDFIAAMHWRAKQQAVKIYNYIDFTDVKTMLDLGGGSGAYSIAFGKLNPNLKISVFDLPDVVPFTQGYIEMEGCAGRIDTIPGDYLTDDLGKGYDLVFVSQILHSNSFWDNLDLCGRIYESLNRRGKILIQEFMINEDRTSPLFSSLFSLNMLVGTEAGDVLSETDMWILLKESWFTEIHKKETEFGTLLISGKK